MAIHVRPINRTRNILLQRLRKMLMLAAFISLGSLIVGSIVLYLNYILIEQERDTAFTYVRIEEDAPITPPEPTTNKELSGGASSTAMDVMPSVIVSTTPAATDMLTSLDTDLGEGLGTDALGGLGLGFGLGGDGLGEGFGTGSGKGHGDGENGKGKRNGYNDDIQVVLALDASGSMDQLFAAVAESLENVLDTLSKAKLNGAKTKVNVGIVVYGQARANGAPFVLSKFTTKIAQLRNKVKETACDGANEECGAAIRLAADAFPWNMRERDDMLKVIFICGNEPFDQGPVDYREAIAHARSKNIIINTVYCGSTDEQWAEAAILGSGHGISYELSSGANTADEDEADMHRILQELHKLPLYPVGSPAVQQDLLKRYANSPPPPKGKKQLSNWLTRNRERVISGFAWDAAEICRRVGPENFKLDQIGGRGNLPLSLRGMSDEQALNTICQAAQQRRQLLENYKRSAGGSDFAIQILETLREQALDKGINIEL